jgi:anti-sigma regulatory factor (Ser/Thr protein kinase)
VDRHDGQRGHGEAPDPLEVDATSEAPCRARRYSNTALDDLAVPGHLRWAPLLVVSELVTNVVQHGGRRLRLQFRRHGDVLRVEVTDDAVAGLPPPGAEAHGRGLEIVDTLATDWGVEPVDDGKTVWCELSCAAPADACP